MSRQNRLAWFDLGIRERRNRVDSFSRVPLPRSFADEKSIAAVCWGLGYYAAGKLESRIIP